MQDVSLTLRVRWLSHHGARVLLVDFSDLSAEEVYHVLALAHRTLAREPARSANVLSDIHRIEVDVSLLWEIEKTIRANRPYVRRSAVVGVPAGVRFLLDTLRATTGRLIRPFTDRDDALEWLCAEGEE